MIKRKAPLSLLVTLDSISKNTLDFFSVSQSRQCLQIIGCDKVILRYLNSLLLILFVSIAATSCSDDNHKIIEQPSINVLSYYPKSMNIVELQYKPAGQEPGVVDIDKSSLYLGDRVTMFQPEKIIFKNDSVSIIKRGGLIQEYKAEWNKGDLYLYNGVTGIWDYCGSKDGEVTFILNTGFFWVKDNNMHGSLSVIGQKYSLLSYSELVTYLGGNSNNLKNQVAWLRVQYTFELIPEVKL